MNGLLSRKVAIVTGGGSGIGRTTALLFAAQDARVAVFDLNAESAQACVEEIALSGGQAIAVAVDMTQADQVEAAVRQVVERLSSIDIMVNVAGGSGRRWGDGPADSCTLEGWEKTLALNLTSVFLGCKYTLQVMKAQGRGAIVNVASVLGLVGGGGDFDTHAYAASKGGVISLTRSIATYYAPHHIRANVICPGLIATPMSWRAQSSPTIRTRLAALQPLTGDFGQPSDVAGAALYLASDATAFVTGTVLTVDGGWTAQ